MSQMYSSLTSAQKLRSVLIAEKSDCSQRLERYKTLTQKIADYQMGRGSAPTEEEFSQWLADVDHAVDLTTRLAGS